LPSAEDFTAGSATRSLAYLMDLAAAAFLFMILFAVLDAFGQKPDSALWLALPILGYQAYFLVNRGGVTPGKFIRNICVISASGQQITTGQGLMRAALTTLPYACLASGELEFDVVAHGVVAMVPVAGIAYLFADLVLLEYTRAKRTVTDYLCKTIVVNLPPLQPHRAPAIPMFSANDAEFGNPPKRPPS
jgi:uncharacterized RDD family membrane protein YckC